MLHINTCLPLRQIAVELLIHTNNNNMTPHRGPMITKQLILSKYLFKKGDDTLKDGSSFSAGLAISLFQDAVEILVWTIAKEYSISVKPADSFEKLLDGINKIEKDGKTLELAYRARMIELNKARVNFKHYGNLPAASEAEKFRDYVANFLTTTCTDYFNINFNDVTLADIINNDEIRTKIKEAEQCFKDEDIQGSITKCAYAGYLAFNTFDKILPRVDSTFTGSSILPDSDVNRNANVAFRYYGGYMNTLRDLTLASLLKIKVIDYLQFKQIAPQVLRSGNGSFQAVWLGPKPTQKDASFCIDFVITCALAIEETYYIQHHKSR